jgi:hypothetical protein
VLGVAAKRVGKLLARYHVVQGPFTPIARWNLFQLRRDRGKRRIDNAASPLATRRAADEGDQDGQPCEHPSRLRRRVH